MGKSGTDGQYRYRAAPELAPSWAAGDSLEKGRTLLCWALRSADAENELLRVPHRGNKEEKDGELGSNDQIPQNQGQQISINQMSLLIPLEGINRPALALAEHDWKDEAKDLTRKRYRSRQSIYSLSVTHPPNILLHPSRFVPGSPQQKRSSSI